MANTKNESREVTFTIEKHLGTIDVSQTGWTKELNLVSWNEGTPKFDIRDWAPDHEHMSRGVTLTAEEMKSMKQIIDKMLPELRDPALKSDREMDISR